ncbi:hypothetical protein GDO81_001345 [Engystomops pustulosus]|uniref:MHC class I antigen n=1 Tax=Engystomops pustulosus TaxID=76066 RepID=A0AAV7DFA0_ENGPU|nr:hypothetical protein GDO81_001345 [Engystomops pustulosus]
MPGQQLCLLRPARSALCVWKEKGQGGWLERANGSGKWDTDRKFGEHPAPRRERERGGRSGWTEMRETDMDKECAK